MTESTLFKAAAKKNASVLRVLLVSSPLEPANTYNKCEYIQEDVTYRMLFSNKYRRMLITGCALMMLQQTTGVNSIYSYSLYFGFKGHQYGMRFILAILKEIFTLISVYFVVNVGRRPLLMWGYLIACLCNWIMFQVYNDRGKDYIETTELINLKTSISLNLLLNL